MTITFAKTRWLLSCLIISVLVHILFFYAWKISGTYNFAGPVTLSQTVDIDLTKPAESAAPEEDAGEQEDRDTDQLEEEPALKESPANNEEKEADSPSVTKETPVKSADALSKPATPVSTVTPLSEISGFLGTKSEKLTYLVSMFGIPVGSAVLESKNENGEISINLRVTSNIAISSVFPVDDSIDTRHIAGSFIMARVRQREGSFTNDEGFTINLKKKRVSWFDYVSGRSLTIKVPTEEVLDTLSGFYYLRNRQLQVGTTEMLHIYDSETYADVPVEILNRETIRLPNLQEVNTLVVKPLQKTAGIFRRTGDIFIWMTDDAFKVPVKIVTSVALGTVTIELISAESTLQEAEPPKNKPELN